MSPVFWMIVVLLFCLLCLGSKGTAGKKSAGAQGKATRIDHRHYIDEDDYECSVCGARFRKGTMVCPSCGAKFVGTRVDEDEFEEEMMEEEDWDEDD